MSTPRPHPNPCLRDYYPDLQQLILRNVTPTGRTIGFGSHGSVMEVAIPGAVCAAKKIYDFLFKEDKVEETIQKYVSECKMMSRLRHPNMVQFIGIWFSKEQESNLPALVMEKMLISLHDLLEPAGQSKRKPHIRLKVKCSILQDVAQGIAFLHSQSPPLVHRNLSARNVLLNSAMVAKIADMGMVQILPSLKSSTVTKIPAADVYMPPEALEDPSKYDTSIDIFSLGVIGWLSG